MFDRIAGRYDLLNHLLSFGQDIFWRKKVSQFIPDRTGMQLLDLATGTGDQLISIVKNTNGKISAAIGIDLAEKMLEIGRKKIAENKMQNIAKMQLGNATEINFDKNSFDVLTISFGIRNVTDVKKSLSRMRTVLKNNGRLLILEFSLPQNKLIKNLYLFYFRKILPLIGGLISGDSYAYNYLNKTVETFPFGNDFCALLQNAGFEKVHAYPLTFGIATIYTGDKVNEN